MSIVKKLMTIMRIGRNEPKQMITVIINKFEVNYFGSGAELGIGDDIWSSVFLQIFLAGVGKITKTGLVERGHHW